MSSKFKFLVLIIFTHNAWSQNNLFLINNSNLIVTMSANSLDETTNKIEGSQYIDEQFYPSTFSCLSEVTPPIRYNVYKEEMEFIFEGKLYYLNKNKIENCEITLYNNTYKYIINYDNKESNGYLVILNKSKDLKYILYKKEKVKYVPKYIPSSTYADERPAKYVIEKSKYFIKIQDSLIEFPEKTSELLKLFPNFKDSIEYFLKEKKVKFIEESSLLELMNFLNTL